jgi:hypothetical protein
MIKEKEGNYAKILKRLIKNKGKRWQEGKEGVEKQQKNTGED